MPIDFPNSPSVGQTFTVGSRTWQWTGSVWQSAATQGAQGATGPTGPTGPAGPVGTLDSLSDVVITGTPADFSLVSYDASSARWRNRVAADANLATLAGATFTGAVAAPALIPSSSTAPTNGMFLGAANTLSFAASSANRVNISSAGLTVLRIDATNEGGQLSLARSSDNATGWFLDVFGTGTDTNLRFVQNTSGGELERASFNTTGQLVANPAVPTAANSAKAVGYVGMPQNAPTISGAYTYTFGLADAGEHFYATGTPSSVTLTIPASGVTNFEIGTTIVIINDLGAATNISIAINTDTLVLAGTGATGTRTLARYGMATLVKVTGTKWYISGNGLT